MRLAGEPLACPAEASSKLVVVQSGGPHEALALELRRDSGLGRLGGPAEPSRCSVSSASRGWLDVACSQCAWKLSESARIKCLSRHSTVCRRDFGLQRSGQQVPSGWLHLQACRRWHCKGGA